MSSTLTRRGTAVAVLAAATFAAGATLATAPDASPRTPSSVDQRLADYASFADLAVGAATEIIGVDLHGQPADLVLERFDVLEDGAPVIIGDQPGTAPEVVLLRGTIEGESDSKVFMGISRWGTHGFVRRDGELSMISTGPLAAAERDFAVRVTRASDLPPVGLEVPVCGLADADVPFEAPPAGGGIAGEGPCRVVRVAVDTDWEFTSNLFGGSAGPASAYALTLIAAVSEIYQEDINARLLVSYLRVWLSDTDPYNQGDSLLTEFRNHWNAEQNAVERDVAHLLSGRQDTPWGGIAYLSVICSGNNGYGVSAHLNGTFPYPLVDNSGGNWDLVVVAHELGHNFGSPHTHSFNPPIDNCGNGDCTGASDGTIMSYCHTCPGGLTNIALDFHPLVEQTMLNFLDGLSCDLTAEGANAIDDVAATFEGGSVIIDVLLNDLAASCESDDVVIADFDTISAAGGNIVFVPADLDNPRDRLSYGPPSNYDGNDTFTYELANGAIGTVHIDVETLRDPDVTGPTEPGLATSYYALSSPSSLPDFDLLEPYAAEIVDNVDYNSTNGFFAGSGLTDEVGAVFEGYVIAQQPGLYTFHLESDDGSRLFIGEEMVVDNDGLHGMVEQSGTIGLALGKHAIRIEFFENGGGAGLIASWTRPTIGKQVITAGAFSHGVGCDGDVDGNGTVDGNDLGLLLGAWGSSDPAADIDGNGVVDGADLGSLLSAWGDCS